MFPKSYISHLVGELCASFSVVKSLITCICDFVSFFHLQASRANQMGDRAGAEKNARLARNLNHAAVGLGILVYIIFVAVMVFVLLLY
uniref:Uncharacterized protein n=1 Tax=Oryzias sinensis TaxID=183150 RepID=A0A8C7Z841_9TELE